MKTTIDMMKDLYYFQTMVPNTRPFEEYKKFTIRKHHNDDSGMISGFVKKDEAMMLSIAFGFDHVELIDACEYLSTLN